MARKLTDAQKRVLVDLLDRHVAGSGSATVVRPNAAVISGYRGLVSRGLITLKEQAWSWSPAGNCERVTEYAAELTEQGVHEAARLDLTGGADTRQ